MRAGPQAPRRGATAPPSPGAPRWAVPLALAVAAVAVLHWSGGVQESLDHGIYKQDSTWYHLPVAAGFFQTGNTWSLQFTDPMALTAWFYPMNSELLHAVGMLAFGNDFASPFVNVVWMALTLLAAWCVGRPFGLGAPALLGVAMVLDIDMMQVQAGNAPSDTAGVFFLLGERRDPSQRRRCGAARAANLPPPGRCCSPRWRPGLRSAPRSPCWPPSPCSPRASSPDRARAPRPGPPPCGSAACSPPAATGICATWRTPATRCRGSTSGRWPGPDQVGLYPRPAHSVADYATDFGVWVHQFAPDAGPYPRPSLAAGPARRRRWPRAGVAARPGAAARARAGGHRRRDRLRLHPGLRLGLVRAARRASKATCATSSRHSRSPSR